jgi:hypothetical protein
MEAALCVFTALPTLQQLTGIALQEHCGHWQGWLSLGAGLQGHCKSLPTSTPATRPFSHPLKSAQQGPGLR